MKLGPGAEEIGPRSAASQMLNVAMRGLPPRERILTTPAGDRVHGWWYSKNPGIQYAQKLVDKAHETFPDTSPAITRLLPPLWRSQASRIKSASRAMAQQTAKQATSEGALFAKKWGKIDDVMSLAARMVLEGTLPKDLIQFHKDMLAEGKLKPKDIEATQARLALIPEAAKMLTTKTHKLTDAEGNVVANEKVPVVKTGHAELQQFVDE